MQPLSPESPTRYSCRWARLPDSSGKFHPTAQRHACPLKDRRAQLVKKASQSLPPLAANRVQSVFCRGVYLAENTSQTASVEFVPHRGTNYARSRLPEFVGKAQRGFSTVSPRTFRCPGCSVSQSVHTGITRIEVRPCICSTNRNLAVWRRCLHNNKLQRFFRNIF